MTAPVRVKTEVTAEAVQPVVVAFPLASVQSDAPVPEIVPEVTNFVVLPEYVNGR